MSHTIRLFCVPFAGGNAYCYRDLTEYLSDTIEVVVLELPGRGRRFSEPLLLSLDEMVSDLYEQIRGNTDGAFAFYGHSMGARLVWLLATYLQTVGAPLPVQLIVSGCPAPSAARRRGRHLLPRKKFIATLREMDCPPDVLENEELMQVFEPILRADFEANDTFKYSAQDPLPVPIAAMIGSSEETTREEALRWQEETTGLLRLEEYAGGHFFLFDHLPSVGSLMSETLCSLTAGALGQNPRA